MKTRYATPSFFLVTTLLSHMLLMSFSFPETTINLTQIYPADHGLAFRKTYSVSYPFYYCNTGDINGDNITDLVIGESGYSRISVVYPDSDAFSSMDNQLETIITDSPGFKIKSHSYNIGLSFSILDFNGDGIDDILIETLAQGMNGALIYGRRGGYSDFYIDDLSQDQGFKILSSKNVMLEKAGDINNDGIDDIFVKHTWRFAPRIIYVLYGNSDKLGDINLDLDLENLPSSRGFKIFEPSSALYLDEMYMVSWVGDINHDGVDDFSVKAKYDNATYEVYMIYGKKERSSDLYLDTFTNEQGFRILVHTVDLFMVNHAGDFNNDGISDLIIGGNWLSEKGTAYVIYGKDGNFSDIDLAQFNDSHGFKIINSNPNQFYDLSVGSSGDINKDGIDDIVIGSGIYYSSDWYDTAHIIFGSEHPNSLIDVTTSDNVLTLLSISHLGIRLNRFQAGDLNHDGIDDVFFVGCGTMFGLLGSDCEAYTNYTDCASQVPALCYASNYKGKSSQESSCVSSCSPGYYLDTNSICKVCPLGCAICTSSSLCQKCTEGYFQLDSSCAASCSDGHLKIGSTCHSTGAIIAAIIGAVTTLIVLRAIIHIRRRKRISLTTKGDKVSFPVMRVDSEIPMAISITPTYERKDSYLEQPIEQIHHNDDRHSLYLEGYRDTDNNNEEIEMPDQQRVEYELQSKKAEIIQN